MTNNPLFGTEITGIPEFLYCVYQVYVLDRDKK